MACHPVMLEAIAPRPLRRVSMADCLAVVAAVKPEPAYKPFAISGRYMEWPMWGPTELCCIHDRLTQKAVSGPMSREDALAQVRVMNAAWRKDV